MARIDFPSTGDTHVDENGVVWKKVNNSWVKQFDYADEAPYLAGEQLCKLNQVWTKIVFPVDPDADSDGQIWGRQDGGWVAFAGAAGPTTVGLTPGSLYGIRDGAWGLIPGDDLTTNYYDKTASDGRFSNIGHVHDLTTNPGDVVGLGALAFQEDDPNDGQEYVRKNKAWAVKTEHAKPSLTKSITVIDPIGSDDTIIAWTPVAITVNQIRTAVLGATSPSLVFNVYHDANADGTGGRAVTVLDSDYTANDLTGQAPTPGAGAAIPADSYIWLVIEGEPVNAPTMFHLTLAYSED